MSDTCTLLSLVWSFLDRSESISVNFFLSTSFFNSLPVHNVHANQRHRPGHSKASQRILSFNHLLHTATQELDHCRSLSLPKAEGITILLHMTRSNQCDHRIRMNWWPFLNGPEAVAITVYITLIELCCHRR